MKKIICILLCLLMISGCGSKSLSNSTNKDYLEQYNTGIKYLSDGDYEQAILAFNAALEIEDRVEMYVLLACAYAEEDNYDSANEIINEVIEKYGEDYYEDFDNDGIEAEDDGKQKKIIIDVPPKKLYLVVDDNGNVVGSGTETESDGKSVIWVVDPQYEFNDVDNIKTVENYELIPVWGGQSGYPSQWNNHVLVGGSINSIYEYTANVVKITCDDDEYPDEYPDGVYTFYDYYGNRINDSYFPVDMYGNYPYYDLCGLFIVSDGGNSVGFLEADFSDGFGFPQLAEGLGGDFSNTYVYCESDNIIYQWNDYEGILNGYPWFEFSESNVESFDGKVISRIDSKDSQNIIGGVYFNNGNVYDINGEPKTLVNNMVAIYNDGKYGFYNLTTKSEITECIYDEVLYFEEGYAPVRKDDKWGFIDENGNEVTDFVFEDATTVYDGKAWVKLDGLYGVIDLVSTIEKG